MSTLDKDDIRAAVAAGILDEAQAAATLALADSRRGVRENLDGLDEPFELFKGFNEIFIVVGLCILYGGFIGLTGMAMNAVGLLLIIPLAGYFIRKRRMVAPAIALALMTAGLAGMIGVDIATMVNAEDELGVALGAGFVAVIMFAFWWAFHVPFALLLIAGAVFTTIFALTALGGHEIDEFSEIFLLSADGPFSIITIALGLVALILALRFDLSDPHRVTRRASNAFWLHVVAAPAIMNTIAMTLFQSEGALAPIALLLFVLVMALFAIVIDRRSFLISGVGYVVALAFSVAEGGAFLIILLLGVVLVLLGAKWEAIRIAVMRRLPAFPGKDRLPPYAQG